MALRAGIVVTGTEVLTGRVTDLNGPWLAEELRRIGVDVGQIVVVGDRPEDLHSALTHLTRSHELVITSGGLGPTADDLTAQVVADHQGRPMTRDEALESRIAVIVDRLVQRFGGTLDPEATAAGVRKQAMVPAGAVVLEPVGTAPGLVVPVADGRDGPPVVVLPGPPRELQPMWTSALAEPIVAAVVAGAPELRQSTLRVWGAPESELAALLRRLDADLTGLEITTCLRDGELEIVTRYSPAAEPAQQALEAGVRETFGDKVFSDGPTVDELVLAALVRRGWTLAVTESGVGGGTTARLTRTPGPVLGGLVSVVPAGSAQALAEGARSHFGADVGLGVGTSSSGSAAEPDQVHVVVVTPDAARSHSFVVAGPAAFVRARTTSLALHHLRTTLDDVAPPV